MELVLPNGKQEIYIDSAKPDTDYIRENQS